LPPRRSLEIKGTARLHFLSPPRRPRRSGEWTPDKAATFIVTLAATRCVTLAARAAGMSRKSAYALKDRDCAFAEAWNAALEARDASRPKATAKGDKSDKSDNPCTSPAQGDSGRAAAAWNPLMDDEDGALRHVEAARRDRFFASFARSLDSAPLAARRSRQ
jgi:hypothetical protein